MGLSESMGTHTVLQCYPKQVNIDATSSKCMPPPLQNTWSGYDLDLGPLTLKTFSAMPNDMTNICRKFHQNISTKYSDIELLEIGFDGRTNRQTTDGRPQK